MHRPHSGKQDNIPSLTVFIIQENKRQHRHCSLSVSGLLSRRPYQCWFQFGLGDCMAFITQLLVTYNYIPFQKKFLGSSNYKTCTLE